MSHQQQAHEKRERQKDKQGLDAEQRMLAFNRWMNGEDLQSLADEFGCSFGRMRGICYHLKRAAKLNE